MGKSISKIYAKSINDRTTSGNTHLAVFFFFFFFFNSRDFPVAHMAKNLLDLSRGSGRSSGKAIGNLLQWHSNILAWRIPWTVKSGGLQ